MLSIKSLQSLDQAKINGKWVPVRPINHRVRNLRERLRDAWLVLTGKADALVWPEGQ